MLRKLYQKHRTTVNKFDAVLLNNPVLERGLVIAPVIVAANSLKNALSLGVAFAIITFSPSPFPISFQKVFPTPSGSSETP